jgi:hypothetical protein
MVTFKPSALVATAATVLMYLGVGRSSDEPPARPAVPSPRVGNAGPDQPPADAPRVPAPAGGAEPRDRVAGVTLRTPNFEVHAPTAVAARVIAAEAEFHRKELALKWLGRELPAWSSRCQIQFDPGAGGDNGTTAFTFGTSAGGKPVLASARMDLRGDFMHTLTALLPHEVMHAVLATHFAKPLPRWADEGLATLAESGTDPAAENERCLKLLDAGRGVRMSAFLRMTEYPRDLLALYSQGQSVARFLVSTAAPVGDTELKDLPDVGDLFKSGSDAHRRLIAFIRLGGETNTAESWARAAKVVYGFKSLDELEKAWLAWLKTSAGSAKAGE